jgi:hypothetical protein
MIDKRYTLVVNGEQESPGKCWGFSLLINSNIEGNETKN